MRTGPVESDGDPADAAWTIDGDTWPDLVVGEYFWNSNPEDLYSAYGRINVFRGPVGR